MPVLVLLVLVLVVLTMLKRQMIVVLLMSQLVESNDYFPFDLPKAKIQGAVAGVGTLVGWVLRKPNFVVVFVNRDLHSFCGYTVVAVVVHVVDLNYEKS